MACKMKTAMVLYLFLFLASLSATAVDAQQKIPFGRYHALVIGNNDYEHLKPLRTAIADAEAIAKILEDKYGFKVTLYRNAKRQTIVDAMNQLIAELTEKDNLLIYYAGHGTLDEYTNTGYWQPIDSRPDSDTFWIPTTDINRYLTRMNAKHVLVIADSCYAGVLLTRGETSQLASGEEPQTWLRRMLEQRSRTALTSGWLEPVQDVGSGGHSVFADVLLKFLRDNDSIIDGHGLFERIKRPVTIRAVDTEQIPQYADIKSPKHEGGDFLLVPNKLKDLEVSRFTSSNLPDWLFRGETRPGRLAHCAKPTTPVLVYPEENGIQPNHYYGEGKPWKFSWLESTCEGGSIIKYHIIVHGDGALTAAVDRFVSEPRFVGDTSGTISGHNWTWKVRALDDKNQFSDWSEVRRFSVPDWDVIDINPKPKAHIEDNRITMEPGTGFIFSSLEVTSGVGSDRDIWWNGIELVPGRRMCSIGHITSVSDVQWLSTQCVLKFAGFVPLDNEGFLLEIIRGGQKLYAVIRVLSVGNKIISPTRRRAGTIDSSRSVTFEWLYPYSP